MAKRMFFQGGPRDGDVELTETFPMDYFVARQPVLTFAEWQEPVAAMSARIIVGRYRWAGVRTSVNYPDQEECLYWWEGWDDALPNQPPVRPPGRRGLEQWLEDTAWVTGPDAMRWSPECESD